MTTEEEWAIIEQKVFVDCFNQVAKQVYDNSANHGFWKDSITSTTPVKLMLTVSELAEAMEADRIGNPQSEKIPAHTQIEEELADAVIRIMDLAAYNGWDLGQAIINKMIYNANRPFMYGGKRY